MTSTDTQALIEEARQRPNCGDPGCLCTLTERLADALEASEAARKDLTDKIEALCADIKRAARSSDLGINFALARAVQRLCGLLSGGSKGEHGLYPLVVTNPDDDHSTAYAAAVVQREERSDG